MLATERRQRIMQEMHEHKVVVIVELAEKLGVTPMTIRRDLNLLEQQGLVAKDLEPYIGSSGRVSEVLNRKRALSLRMIKRLHDGLRIPYESLLSRAA